MSHIPNLPPRARASREAKAAFRKPAATTYSEAMPWYAETYYGVPGILRTYLPDSPGIAGRVWFLPHQSPTEYSHPVADPSAESVREQIRAALAAAKTGQWMCLPRGVRYAPALENEPITPRWLRENGWFDLHRSDRPGLHRREVACEVLGGRRPFVSHDDLCIDVMPSLHNPPAGTACEWHCWVHQQDPHRHIHVRPVMWTWELCRLWEGLTGRTWGEV